MEPPTGEWDRLADTLNDDFNTPAALAILHEWRSRGYWALLGRGLEIFGLGLTARGRVNEQVDRLRRQRDEARAEKDWARADTLRDAIRGRGFDVIDEPSGSRLIAL